jgi:hypothetical protein
MFCFFAESSRFSPFIKFFSYILIFSFILSITGCETVKFSKYTPEELEITPQLVNDIDYLVLKNGNFEKINDRKLFFYKKYKDTDNVLVITNSSDTATIIENGLRVNKIQNDVTVIPISEIRDVYVSKVNFDTEKTILTVIGITAGIFLLGLLTLSLYFSSHPIKCCPYIYAFDGKNYVLDAEPLGGAICEGLSRTDYSDMDYLRPTDGKFKILVRNENDETQYIDELSLININHSAGEHVSKNQQGEFFKYKSLLHPLSVIDEKNTDITNLFLENDNIKWQTDLPVSLNEKLPIEKHALHFKFKRDKDARNAMILINSGTAVWGSYMIKEILSLYGKEVNDWYGKIFNGSEEQKNLYSFMLREEMFYLKLNLLEKEGFKTKAVLRGGGPLVDEDILLNIPLENTGGDYIDFTLNPPPGFWKIDKVGIIYDYEKVNEEDIIKLKCADATEKTKNDISNDIFATDKNYYVMPVTGNRCSLQFDVPYNYSRETSSLFLKTSGWYEIHLDKTADKNDAMLNKIMNVSGSIIEYTLSLYYQQLQNYTLSSKINY